MNAKFVFASIALSAALTVPTAAFAQHHGGGHSGGGSHSSRGSGGSAHGGGQSHLNFGGHSYGGHSYGGRSYGYSHNVYGYRPYYGYGYSYYRPHYGPFYGGLALGLFVSTLPRYYDTYYWHDVPYYYYGNNYYRYSDSVGKYEVVAPPAEVVSDTERPVNSQRDSQIFAYPKEHQSEDQQRTDRYECHAWAVNETGVDPSKDEAIAADTKGDYRRAEGACLTGRGYSVR